MFFSKYQNTPSNFTLVSLVPCPLHPLLAFLLLVSLAPVYGQPIPNCSHDHFCFFEVQLKAAEFLNVPKLSPDPETGS